MRNMQTIHKPVGKAGQAVTTNTSTAANATAIGEHTYAVRLCSSTDAFVEFEGAATKTTGMFLPANHPEVFSIDPTTVISVIADTGAGKLYITEITA